MHYSEDTEHLNLLSKSAFCKATRFDAAEQASLVNWPHVEEDYAQRDNLAPKLAKEINFLYLVDFRKTDLSFFLVANARVL